MAENVATQQVSILSLYHDCTQSFQSLLQAPHDSEHKGLFSTLRKQWGRFQVWVENAGAHRQNRVSLDYRLREASKVKGMVLKLLKDLEEDLQDAIDVMSGRAPSDENSSCSSSNGLEEAQSAEVPDINPEYSELEECIVDIADVITCLYEFSIAIRNPAPGDRLQKCSSIDVSHFEFYDIQHVSAKFKDAPQYLQERLGKANVRRRQLLRYYELHHDKIAGRFSNEINHEDSQQKEDAPLLESDPQANNEQELAADKSNPDEKEKGDGGLQVPLPHAAKTIATKKTETTISLFLPKQDCNIDTDACSEAQTQTSYSSSVGDDAYTIRVPPLPENGLDRKPFQCPFCFSIISVRGQHSWKRHVFQDLRPYVCTFEGCAKSQHLFNSQSEWFEHETEFHRRSWHCNMCDKVYFTKDGFAAHLKGNHCDSYSERYLSTVIERCEGPNQSDQLCLLCGGMQPYIGLQRHLGRHMQQTALFVLRPQKAEEGGASASGGARGDSEEDSRELGDSDLEFHSKASARSNELGSPDAQEPVDRNPVAKDETSPADTAELNSRAAIHFRDAMGREFVFPFESCGTWEGVQELIKEETLRLESSDQRGQYDLYGPDGQPILSQHWESFIEPGMSITMCMRPSAEDTISPSTEPDAITSQQPQPPLHANTELEQDAARSKPPDRGERGQTQGVPEMDSPEPATLDRNAKDKGMEPDGEAPMTGTQLGELLCQASENGDLQACKMLLGAGAGVNFLNRQKLSPLQVAALNGHIEVVKLLLQREDVDVNSQDKEGRTPLLWAMANGEDGVVKLLLEREDVDVNLQDRRYGQTPLSCAAKKGCDGVVKLLLEREDVDVNLQDKEGRTPLSWAAENGRDGVVKLLLEREDVDVNLQDKGGSTPLSWAAMFGKDGVVKLLLEREDVDVNLQDKEGRTPLRWAAMFGKDGVVKLLLEREDVDVNLQDKEGRTPLWWAARRRRDGVVKLLLEREDVDVNLQDEEGRAPLSWAALNGIDGVVKLLLEREDVDVNLQDKGGSTPLSLAVADGNDGVVKLLLEREDVDVNLQDEEGRTPLSRAKMEGHRGVAKLLSERASTAPDHTTRTTR